MFFFLADTVRYLGYRFVVLVDQFVFGFLGLALCDANYVFFFGQQPFGFGVSIFKL
jgi:hypothetical protein